MRLYRSFSEDSKEKSASWKYTFVYINTKLKWWRIHTHSLSNKFLISWQAARTELFCLSLSWPPANLASNLASIRILEIHNKPVWLPRLFPEERCLSNTIKTVWTIFHREAKQKKKGRGGGVATPGKFNVEKYLDVRYWPWLKLRPLILTIYK